MATRWCSTGSSCASTPTTGSRCWAATATASRTFAKLIAGRLEPMAGELVRARGLKVGFFAQHQIEDLEPERDGRSSMSWRRRPSEREQQIRAWLARFGLGQDKAETQAGHLSGGEKTRLALALMCLDAPQLLILDEPTNHLDIDSREALVEAVNEFPGAVIVISHDRHLVELVADRLWLVDDGRVRPYDGDLDDYRRLLLETSRRAGRSRPSAARPDRRSAPASAARCWRRCASGSRRPSATIERLDAGAQPARGPASPTPPATPTAPTSPRCRSAWPSSRR